MIRRLPIRWRLALAFTLAMALVLLVAGAVLQRGLARELDEGVDDALRARSDAVAALVAGGGGLAPPAGLLADPDERIAQVIDADGAVADASSPALRAPLLSAPELARARAGALLLRRDGVPEAEGRARILARPVAPGDARVVVVAASLASRDDAVDGLVPLLLIVGPLALLAASGLGYAVAAAALRPVEAMRAQAAAMSGADPGARLGVPPARDELRRLGETLNALLGRLDDAVRRERAFAADAGHELRTPVAIVRAEVDVALAEGAGEEGLRAALASIGEEADRLAVLADRLIALARAEGAPPALAAIDAGALVEGVRRRFARRAEACGRALGAEAPDGVVVHGDARLLEEALGNLVDNALRHGAGPVVVGARRDGDGAALWDRAAGGIEAALAARAFERFARGDAARTGPGAGLGLAVVRAVARAHGGDAEIATPAAGGVEVRIRLP